MLIEELTVFESLARQLRHLEVAYANSLGSLEKVKHEIASINNSNEQTFGFIITVSREEKLRRLQFEESKLRVDAGVGNELLTLAYKVIVEVEIPTLKALKKQRFEKLIFDFSQSRIEELEKELLMWQTINLPDEEEDFGNQKIEKQDFKFTQLPPRSS